MYFFPRSNSYHAFLLVHFFYFLEDLHRMYFFHWFFFFWFPCRSSWHVPFTVVFFFSLFDLHSMLCLV
ncbi:hypothetical protein DsansV1_C17g0144691 [Dioscorea sansibarensis]